MKTLNAPEEPLGKNWVCGQESIEKSRAKWHDHNVLQMSNANSLFINNVS